MSPVVEGVYENIVIRTGLWRRVVFCSWAVIVIVSPNSAAGLYERVKSVRGGCVSFPLGHRSFFTRDFKERSERDTSRRFFFFCCCFDSGFRAVDFHGLEIAITGSPPAPLFASHRRRRRRRRLDSIRV